MHKTHVGCDIRGALGLQSQKQSISCWSLLFSSLTMACGLLQSVDADEYKSLVPLGPASCASATCHGHIIDTGSAPTWRSSFSIWEAHDPHARAGLALGMNRSRRIAARLDPTTTESEARLSAFLRDRCVPCHATTSRVELTAPADPTVFSRFLTAGVSCESCHGLAAGWIVSHTFANWERNPHRYAPPIGMQNMHNPLVRVDVCSRCHIGSHSAEGLYRDMNHDMIAAGHPPLRSNPTELLNRMPRHWNFNPTSASVDTITEQAAACRFVSNYAQLALERMSAAKVEKVPIPEFSEFGCSSCHHDLEFADTSLKRKSGIDRWLPWQDCKLENLPNHLTLPTPRLADFLSVASREPIMLQLQDLMTQSRQHSEDLMTAANKVEAP